MASAVSRPHTAPGSVEEDDLTETTRPHALPRLFLPGLLATALVLRVVEFSETSSILTIFTREFGKVRGLAKGARRPKGPFESALDLLCLCRIVFLRKSSDALDLLTEAKLERRFRPRDLSSLYAGYYVAELLSEFTDDYDPHPELFDAACDTLAGLVEEGRVASLVLRFELTALRVLGHLPSWEVCAECAEPVAIEGQVAFSQADGGVLCAECRVGKRQITLVSAGVLRILGRYSDPASDAWRRLELDRRIRGELRGLLNHYLYHLLGHKLRLHDYLGNAI
jgi:DNA repair protein RecO (recombination protein O)